MAKNLSLQIRPSLSLKLENFRLFSDTRWFRLAPLTCLVGRNSSGKSSIISALLLLKQSIEQGAMSLTQTPLLLVGPYCDLGNFSDVVHNHNEGLLLSISIGARFSDLKSVPMDRTFPFYNLIARRQPSSFRSGFYYRYSETKLPKSGQVKARLSFTKEEPFGPSLNRIEITVENTGAASFVRTAGGERRQHWRVYTTDLPKQSLYIRPTRGFFPLVEVHEGSYSRSGPRMKHNIRTFVAAIQGLFDFISRALLKSEVIGPFRTPPERRYAFSGFGGTRNIPSGEGAVDLLITEALLAAKESKPLRETTAFWIRHLTLATSLDVKDIARRLNLFELDVTGAGRGDTLANLADVGFGISQVLPVIVQGLLTPPGAMYIVQQPEIHLHPDAQAGLADFFMFLAARGVITIVETHSEYLLLRLRRRLAEGGHPTSADLPNKSDDLLPLSRQDVSVILTESDDSGKAFVTELEIGDSFQFDNLPAGFMTQAMDDRVRLLKAIGKNND